MTKDETIEPSLAESRSGEAVWKHVKTGGLYIEIGRGCIEATCENVMVYRSVKHGTIWVRPEAEFMDGRFVLLPASAATAPFATAVSAIAQERDVVAWSWEILAGDQWEPRLTSYKPSTLPNVRAIHPLYLHPTTSPSAISEAPASADAGMREALEAARQFIVNGVELGYIHIPKNDPAEHTLRKISAALKDARNE